MPEISLLELFLTFFYIGLFTIGGGLVAITLMQQTIVEKGFISVDEFYNMIAISESTPGPVGVNMATFLGYKFYGPLGAILASIAEVLPSLICILIIARFILKFRENAVVQTVFSFLRPCATGMIFVIAVQMCTSILLNLPSELKLFLLRSSWKEFFNWMNISFFLLMFYLRRRFKLHPIFIVLLGALFGIAFY